VERLTDYGPQVSWHNLNSQLIAKYSAFINQNDPSELRAVLQEKSSEVGEKSFERMERKLFN
jgi:hypothetical protein